jgi:hypothetical protein
MPDWNHYQPPDAMGGKAGRVTRDSEIDLSFVRVANHPLRNTGLSPGGLGARLQLT